jgi:hypothetical protein
MFRAGKKRIGVGCSFCIFIFILTSSVVPWGRFLPLRADLVAAGKTEAEGGTGGALRFWEWSEEQVKRYL